MAHTLYSVTLTGKVQAGKDAPAVWRRVEHLLKLDAETFRQRVLARLPITLQAADGAVAERQYAAVLACGADAELLAEDDAPRLWLHIDEATHGPVSHAYAESALARGDLDPGLRACELGEQAWLPLRQVCARPAPPEEPPAAAAPAPRRHGDAQPADLGTVATAQARANRSAGLLPGWGIAGIMITLAIVLVAIFIVLAVRT